MIPDRTKRIKDAKSEAHKEIEEYRQQKEEEFKKFEGEVRIHLLYWWLTGKTGILPVSTLESEQRANGLFPTIALERIQEGRRRCKQGRRREACRNQRGWQQAGRQGCWWSYPCAGRCEAWAFGEDCDQRIKTMKKSDYLFYDGVYLGILDYYISDYGHFCFVWIRSLRSLNATKLYIYNSIHSAWNMSASLNEHLLLHWIPCP